jgi:hypothetical protein
MGELWGQILIFDISDCCPSSFLFHINNKDLTPFSPAGLAPTICIGGANEYDEQDNAQHE